MRGRGTPRSRGHPQCPASPGLGGRPCARRDGGRGRSVCRCGTPQLRLTPRHSCAAKHGCLQVQLPGHAVDGAKLCGACQQRSPRPRLPPVRADVVQALHLAVRVAEHHHLLAQHLPLVRLARLHRAGGGCIQEGRGHRGSGVTRPAAQGKCSKATRQQYERRSKLNLRWHGRAARMSKPLHRPLVLSASHPAHLPTLQGLLPCSAVSEAPHLRHTSSWSSSRCAPPAPARA